MPLGQNSLELLHQATLLKHGSFETAITVFFGRRAAVRTRWRARRRAARELSRALSGVLGVFGAAGHWFAGAHVYSPDVSASHS